MKAPISLETLFPDRASGEPLAAQLIRRLRGAVESGFFPPAARILPSRELARQLGLSRDTVVSAIEQLVAEGYLESRVGAGTFVTGALARSAPRTAVVERALPPRARALLALKAPFDELGSTTGPLRLGASDLGAFPIRTWQRLSRELLGTLGDGLAYGNVTGLPALRAAISRHVAQFRGVVAEPERIVVVDGAQAAYHLIALVLAAAGDTIAIEDPCYYLARTAFRARGLRLHGVPVDDDGLQVEGLPRAATLAYVTPCHQFPLGGALSLERRLALLDWARRTEAYVVEDDYDSEFDAHPLPALQSLDRDGRVIYVGTFSKTLAPGLRIGYLVVPPHLVEAFAFACAVANVGSAQQLQAVVAAFIARGHFVRHVRRMAGLYQRRRRVLVEALADGLPPGFRIGPAQTGLHLALMGPPGLDDVRLSRSFGAGRRAYPLSLLCIERDDCRGLVLGCSAKDETAIRSAALAVLDGVRAAAHQRDVSKTT